MRVEKKFIEQIKGRMPDVEYWSVRLEEETMEVVSVNQGDFELPTVSVSKGALISVVDAGGVGYAGTPDVSVKGIVMAARRAREWAKMAGRYALFTSDIFPRFSHKGEYRSACAIDPRSMSIGDKADLLQRTSKGIYIDERIVDWGASLLSTTKNVFMISSDEGEVSQEFKYIHPHMYAVASYDGVTEQRSCRLYDTLAQGGLEQLDRFGMPDDGARIASEAIELVEAKRCPDGEMDMIVLPDQLYLQVHESIGHALEIDRILGDERNFAGSTFVTLDMFGGYQYGSPMLNVTFDPGVEHGSASYKFDDDGCRAKKEYLIKDGILKRGIGGALSQVRSGLLKGVACARSSGWNRAPIDRMANINIEPGNSSIEEMISTVEFGVLMDTNKAFSIDDHRNKFQFGCEYGRLIRDGELMEVVRNPNYRGQTVPFWHKLDMVGSKETLSDAGTSSCGKGEPNQEVAVGHSVPACLFRDIDVFGGSNS